MAGAPARRPTGERQRFVLFVVTGGISAIFNLVTRALCSTIMSYEAAISVAYLVGMTIAFLLSRRFVFEVSSRTPAEQYTRFAMVNVLSFCITLGVSLLFARMIFPAIGFTRHAEDVAHFIGVGSPTLVSYYAHKHFSFGGRAA